MPVNRLLIGGGGQMKVIRGVEGQAKPTPVFRANQYGWLTLSVYSDIKIN